MDLFQYRAIIVNLESLKYVRELEAEVRNLNDKLNANYYYTTTYRVREDYLKYKFLYKAYTKALNLFSNKSKKQLPEFIYKHKHIIHTALRDNLIKTKDEDRLIFTYDELIDLLEFDTVLTTSPTSFEIIPVLHNIIQDKPIHFTINFKQFNLDNFS
jgi:hypothetical protein